MKDKKEKNNTGKWIIIILLVIAIVAGVLFPEKEISCDKTVTKTEEYYEREPYTVCAGTSFWTGDCNEWKTEYKNVRKTRQINVVVQVPKKVNWIFGDC